MAKTIEQELKQTRPIGSPHEQAVLGLMRTSRAIEECWQAYLKRTQGISISQYNILRILRGARPRAIKTSDIAYFNTIFNTSLICAPSAMRMPISRVRCVTA